MKKVKIFLPLLAILFAVFGALATNTQESLVATPVTNDQLDCDEFGFCSDDTTVDCAVSGSGVPLYRIGATCDARAKGTHSPIN